MFVWMIAGQKRVAYQRVKSRDIIYSIVDEERGKFCGKVQTMLLRVSLLLLYAEYVSIHFLHIYMESYIV